VFEVAAAGKDHCNSVAVGHPDDFLVPD
jgi:hypothetical protein